MLSPPEWTFLILFPSRTARPLVRKHGQAALLELLGRHLSELLRGVWLQAKRVELDVSRVVVIVQELLVVTLASLEVRGHIRGDAPQLP